MIQFAKTIQKLRNEIKSEVGRVLTTRVPIGRIQYCYRNIGKILTSTLYQKLITSKDIL